VSDHLDAPGLKSPNMDVRVDITDIFAFQNPANPTRSFLAMSLFTGVRGRGILGSSLAGCCITSCPTHTKLPIPPAQLPNPKPYILWC
jgi:hypothetical protein